MEKTLKIVCLFVVAMYTIDKCSKVTPKEREIIEKERYSNNHSETPVLKEGEIIRGYDFQKGTYRIIPTDQQIRDMREANPHLIIKVPGRVIRNERRLHEDYIERYIEDNIDDILDRYSDY